MPHALQCASSFLAKSVNRTLARRQGARFDEAGEAVRSRERRSVPRRRPLASYFNAIRCLPGSLPHLAASGRVASSSLYNDAGRRAASRKGACGTPGGACYTVPIAAASARRFRAALDARRGAPRPNSAVGAESMADSRRNILKDVAPDSDVELLSPPRIGDNCIINFLCFLWLIWDHCMVYNCSRSPMVGVPWNNGVLNGKEIKAGKTSRKIKVRMLLHIVSNYDLTSTPDDGIGGKRCHWPFLVCRA